MNKRKNDEIGQAPALPTPSKVTVRFDAKIATGNYQNIGPGLEMTFDIQPGDDFDTVAALSTVKSLVVESIVPVAQNQINSAKIGDLYQRNADYKYELPEVVAVMQKLAQSSDTFAWMANVDRPAAKRLAESQMARVQKFVEATEAQAEARRKEMQQKNVSTYLGEEDSSGSIPF